MRDISKNLAVRQSIPPAAYAANTTGLAVNRTGFEALAFLLHVGAWTDGIFTLTAEHSDDGDNWGPVGATDLIGAAVIEGTGSPPAADLAGKTVAVGYVGGKAFVRPKLVASGGPSTGCVFGVDVLLGHAHERPTT